MKKIVLATSLLAISATVMAQDSKNEKIEGNGKIETRNAPVKSFNKIEASGVYELRLTQGSSESVKIEADENLQQYFNVTNNGETLVIDMEKLDKKNVNFSSKNKLIVHLTFKNVNEINVKTVGNVVSTADLKFDNLALNSKGVGNIDIDLTANKVSLKNKGVGNITLSGKAESAEIHNTGVGSIKAGDFVVQALNIENTGIGSAEVNAVKDLKMKATGFGSVRNKGAAPVPKKKKTTDI